MRQRGLGAILCVGEFVLIRSSGRRGDLASAADDACWFLAAEWGIRFRVMICPDGIVLRGALIWPKFSIFY